MRRDLRVVLLPPAHHGLRIIEGGIRRGRRLSAPSAQERVLHQMKVIKEFAQFFIGHRLFRSPDGAPNLTVRPFHVAIQVCEIQKIHPWSSVVNSFTSGESMVNLITRSNLNPILFRSLPDATLLGVVIASTRLMASCSRAYFMTAAADSNA